MTNLCFEIHGCSGFPPGFIIPWANSARAGFCFVTVLTLAARHMLICSPRLEPHMV